VNHLFAEFGVHPLGCQMSPNTLKRGHQTPCFFSHPINTPLQRGETGGGRLGNRFNGFPRNAETVETVPRPTSSTITPLKRGVNERSLYFRLL